MTMKKLMATLAVAALPFGIFAGTAAAETATDSIDVYAGLAPVMELSCTDVNFGVWRTPLGARTDGVATITLNADGSTTPTDATGLALSTNWEGPAAGLCNVTGSAAANGTIGQVAFSSDSGFFVSNGGTGYHDEALPAPGTMLETLAYTLTNSTPAAMSSGATNFKIHGTMIIPDSLISGNYGGYKVSPITVTYTDVNAI